MRLVLAVTNFNRLEYFKKCISTWIKYRDPKFHWTLIIADDGSDSDSLKFIDSINVDNVDLFIIKNNRQGICHLTNKIFNILLEINFDICFKIDNDVFFKDYGWESLYINSIHKYGYDHMIFDSPKLLIMFLE